jgi:ketosteroid isomerase-like protein
MSLSIKPFGPDWLVDYFHMADRLDPQEFVTWYQPDAEFRSGNQPPAVGHAAIIASLTSFYALITTMRHEKTGTWTDEDSGVFEAVAHFTTKDGRTLALPAISSVRLKGNKVSRFLFVMDASPLFQPVPG